jgi:hypothetical protein
MLTFFLTMFWLLLVVSSVAALDVWLYGRGGYHATISYMFLTAAERWPVVSFVVGLALGLLGGHLFWPQ